MTVTVDAWYDIESFADLAHTMIGFLEGTVAETPTHGGPLDPESINITHDLVELTRRGLITDGSQPGLISPTLRQRACVDLLTRNVSVAQDLILGLGHSELLVLVAEPGVELWQNLPMTCWDGEFGTWAGRLGEFHRPHWYDRLGPQASPVVDQMCFVQVLDLQWGRERYLWDQLHAAVDALALPIL